MKAYLQQLLDEQRYEEKAIPLLVEQIGSLDAEVRDGLVYRLFTLYYSRSDLSDSLKQSIFDAMLEKSQMGLGEVGSDSVFTRSFAQLILAHAIQADQQQPSLQEEGVRQLFQQLPAYWGRERDARGYVQERGWAHAIAHASDLVKMSAEHPLFSTRQAVQQLQEVNALLTIGSVYIDDEMERVATAILSLFRHMPDEWMAIEWLEQLDEQASRDLALNGYTPSYFYSRTNRLQLMQHLYFMCRMDRRMPEFTQQLYQKITQTYH